MPVKEPFRFSFRLVCQPPAPLEKTKSWGISSGRRTGAAVGVAVGEAGASVGLTVTVGASVGADDAAAVAEDAGKEGAAGPQPVKTARVRTAQSRMPSPGLMIAFKMKSLLYYAAMIIAHGTRSVIDKMKKSLDKKEENRYDSSVKYFCLTD